MDTRWKSSEPTRRGYRRVRASTIWESRTLTEPFMFRVFTIIFLSLLSFPCHAAVGVRVLLGMTDSVSEPWDGSVSVGGAQLVSMEPWRFEPDDVLTGGASWRASTHPMHYFLHDVTYPIVANGITFWLSDETESTRLNFKTLQGEFTVELSDIPYGRSQKLLNGRVVVDRVPGSLRLTNNPDEQDYPAAVVGKSGDVWVTYVEFKHNPEHDRLRENFSVAPDDFHDMEAPTGGDQVFVRRRSQGVWQNPIAVTSSGRDIYRVAIAADGAGRIWISWSENRDGRFDIYTSCIDDGKPGGAIRISQAIGSNMAPVAAADSGGRVWIAWQGWRNGRASIFVSRQEQDKFSQPFQVSESQANEWNPAIATDTKGHVALVWDSYRNGNYDLYSRIATAGGWGQERAVVTSARYEAYPTIAYDREGRLWIAYEEGAERWGKDFGSFNTTGVAISQGRAIRLVAVDDSGKVFVMQRDFSSLLPGVPRAQVDLPGQQDAAEPLPALFHFQNLTRTENDFPDWEKPHPEQAQKRLPSIESQDIRGPRNSLPRLFIDGSGRLWLAFRSEHPIRWAPIGVVASEYVISFDGKDWTGPIFLAHSDNLIDNRPALISTRPGELLIVGSSDERRHFVPYNEDLRVFTSREKEHGPPAPDERLVPDPYNNDIYVQQISLDPASTPFTAVAMATPHGPPDTSVTEERAAIQRLRSYRIQRPEGELRILRGEFHRHSELSEDGGPDGMLIDQWRYSIDAAGLDWLGCCDHDNGDGREYSWWTTQKLVDAFYAPGAFVSLFSYERSVAYPDGHRNVLLAQRGIRPLPRLLSWQSGGPPAPSPDTQMLYKYLHQFDGIAAVHTSTTVWMGTDWRDNDPVTEPLVEIYQGIRQSDEMPGAPRTSSETDAIGGYRPEGFINRALDLGYHLGFEVSSDHISTHMSYTCVYSRDATRKALMDGLKSRHVYGATDNILADVRSGSFMMGDAFSTPNLPGLQIKLLGTAPFAKVDIIRDGKSVYSIKPQVSQVDFSWTDQTPASQKTNYYYVRGEQDDGELVWTSPIWITYTGSSDLKK